MGLSARKWWRNLRSTGAARSGTIHHSSDAGEVVEEVVEEAVGEAVGDGDDGDDDGDGDGEMGMLRFGGEMEDGEESDGSEDDDDAVE